MKPFPAELGGMGDGLRSGATGAVSGFFSAALKKSAFNASTAKPMSNNGAIGGMFGLPFIIQLENPPLFRNCKQNRLLNGIVMDAAAARLAKPILRWPSPCFSLGNWI